MEKDALFEMDAPVCPTFKLTRHDLEAKDFVSFAAQVFRDQPDLPLFKIQPPTGWGPTDPKNTLEDLVIHTPIQQLVRPYSSWRMRGCRQRHTDGAPRQRRGAGIWQDRELQMHIGGAEGVDCVGCVACAAALVPLA
jgi:hypothetical protein